MRRATVWLLSLLAFSALECRAQGTRTPVLLELFTSEGCSSCPPADGLLATLDREQPVQGADLIVLSEHVDYWNHDGWSDPYSSAAFTERQQRYTLLLHADEPYTPQLVVDGSEQVVGSNWPKAKDAIERARGGKKVPIELNVAGSGSERSVAAKIAPDPVLKGSDVYVVFAADHTESQVRAGENSGRHLAHVSVAYSITKVGGAGRDSGFEHTFRAPAQAKWGGPVRLIVYVQDRATGHILGAAEVKL